MPIGLIWQSEDCHIIQEGRRIQLAKATVLLRFFQRAQEPERKQRYSLLASTAGISRSYFTCDVSSSPELSFW